MWGFLFLLYLCKQYKTLIMRNLDKQKGLIGCSFAPVIIWAYFAICWVVNLVKLIGCDFESPWKEEIIHAIGLFTVLGSGITAWL